MKKIKIFLLVLSVIFTMSLTSCDAILGSIDFEAIITAIIQSALEDALGDVLGHECVVDEWEIVVEPTCVEEGEAEGVCSICLETVTRPVEKIEHDPVEVEAEEPTCTEAGHNAGTMCSECGKAFEGAEPIPALGHSEEIIPAVSAGDGTFAKTEGKKCTVCGVITVKPQTIYPEGFDVYTDYNKYDGDYAYNSLLSFANGAKMQEFYMEIDAVADAFHTSNEDAKSKTVSSSLIYYAEEVTFEDNGITQDEALTVWNAYTIDHPLYYWYSKQVTSNAQFITICVDEDYATAAARREYNDAIYATVKECVESLEGETEIYEITAIFTELILGDAEYAYVPGTETPSNEDWAHNIIGVMLMEEGVCESYAKAFQLLLNFCDVESVFVGGTANGGAHAWNMVKLDNGKWYLYDLTWEDTFNDGSCFCQIELEDHEAYAPGGIAIQYIYVLPTVADTPYIK